MMGIDPRRGEAIQGARFKYRRHSLPREWCGLGLTANGVRQTCDSGCRGVEPGCGHEHRHQQNGACPRIREAAFVELRNGTEPALLHYENLTKHRAALPILQIGCKMQKR